MSQRRYHSERCRQDEGRKVGQCMGHSGLGRTCDKSNEHLLLTTRTRTRSRVVRRIPDGNQASYHAEEQGLP